MMQNPLCENGLGDKQNVFMHQCMKDVIAYNDSKSAQIVADGYGGVCRYESNWLELWF